MPNLDDLIKTINESQKTLFIMCGFSYAGKSFVAEELRKNTDIVYVSIDAIFHKHGFNWNTNKLPGTEEWKKIFDESREQTKTILSEGKNVLYDSTNQTLVGRNELRKIASSVGSETYVIYIQTSVGTVWKRWEKIM